jgi:SNF2 family DNA or RNA helicase
MIRNAIKVPKPSENDDDDEGVPASSSRPKHFLEEFKFHRIVLDECTEMKTHSTMIARALCMMQAKHKWLLSGTPVEDKVQELHSYFKFLGVPFSGEKMKDFKKKYFRFQTELNDKGKKVERTFPRQCLRDLLKDIMIRRTHSTTIFGQRIVPLPALVARDQIVPCRPAEDLLQTKLTEDVQRKIDSIKAQKNAGHLTEKQMHNRIVMQVTRKRLAASNFCLMAGEMSRLTAGPVTPEQVAKMTAAFQKMERDHKRAVQKTAKSIEESENIIKREALKKARGVVKRERFSLKKWIKKGHRMLYSAKDRGVEDQLQAWMNDNPTRKIIVFASFLVQIDIVQHICRMKGWKSKTYHGSMPIKTRTSALQAWREDPSINILLISLRTGGVGLTGLSSLIYTGIVPKKTKPLREFIAWVRRAKQKLSASSCMGHMIPSSRRCKLGRLLRSKRS